MSITKLLKGIGIGILLAACGDFKPDEALIAVGDADGDGYEADEDCDDENPAINPDAPEVCDGEDNDCSGDADDPEDGVWYGDLDGDDYGAGDPLASTRTASHEDTGGVDLEEPGELPKEASGEATLSCPEWASELDTDCNDADATINPRADEICDDQDNDCNGDADSDAIDMSTWYIDNDRDRYGDADGGTAISCDAPSENSVKVGDDCDDTDSDINPGARETCDGTDEDCDGEVDNNPNPLGGYYNTSMCYSDADENGSCESAIIVCSDSYDKPCQSQAECEEGG